MIAQAKSDYESKLTLNYAHTNSSKTFQYISSIKGRKHFPVQMSYNNDHASTDLQKAQLFNNYFYSVFLPSSTFTSEPDTHSSPHSLQNIQFSDSDVLDILTTLDINKACGIDNFSPRIFRYCALPLLQIICRLFSTSLSCGTLPIDWRTHCVVPVYKSSDKSSVFNYRPISLLSILSKVLERLVYNNIIDYLKDKFTKHQFGFYQKDLLYNNCWYLQKNSLNQNVKLTPYTWTLEKPLTLCLMIAYLTNFEKLE